MPTPNQPPPPNLKNDIPPLKTLFPSIFVPVQSSFFDYTPPPSRAAHIREAIATRDTHANHVRDNIIALSKQECIRIARDAEIQEARYPEAAAAAAARGNHGRRPVTTADKATMIANMQVRREPSTNVEVPAVPNFADWKPSCPAEWREREIMGTVSRTLVDLKGFREHMARTRKVYEGALGREEMKAQAETQTQMDVDGREGQTETETGMELQKEDGR